MFSIVPTATHLPAPQPGAWQYRPGPHGLMVGFHVHGSSTPASGHVYGPQPQGSVVVQSARGGSSWHGPQTMPLSTVPLSPGMGGGFPDDWPPLSAVVDASGMPTSLVPEHATMRSPVEPSDVNAAKERSRMPIP